MSEQLSPKEINERIAEKIGWIKKLHNNFDDEWEGSKFLVFDDRQEGRHFIGNYWNPMNSIEQCSIFENWLRKHPKKKLLWAKYCYLLTNPSDIKEDTPDYIFSEVIDRGILATAEQRCNAFLEVFNSLLNERVNL